MSYKEFNAGKVNQINNGEMKAVNIDDENTRFMQLEKAARIMAPL